MGEREHRASACTGFITRQFDVEIRIKWDNYCFAVFLACTKSPHNNSALNLLSHFATASTGNWRGWLVLSCSMAQSLCASMQLQELHLSPSKVLHCENMEFRTFYSSDLDLDQTTFMYEFDSVKGEGVLADQKKLSTSSLSKVILLQTDRRRDRPTDATKHYHAASWVVNCLLYTSPSPRD